VHLGGERPPSIAGRLDLLPLRGAAVDPAVGVHVAHRLDVDVVGARVGESAHVVAGEDRLALVAVEVPEDRSRGRAHEVLPDSRRHSGREGYGYPGFGAATMATDGAYVIGPELSVRTRSALSPGMARSCL